MATFKYRDPQTGQYKSDIHVVGAVSSVNGKNGVVELNAEDVGAMEYYILTFDGTHFYHDGVQLTFTQIKTVCLDEHNFVYAQYDGDLYIPQHIQGALIFFDATYIRNGKAEIHRISVTPAGTGTEVVYVADSEDLEDKQDVIDDIDEIRDGAALGATSLQGSIDPTQGEEIPRGNGLDVRINGESIVEGGVAEIPYASANNAGLVRVENPYGIVLRGGEVLGINYATESQALAKSNYYCPITPAKTDYTVRAGLISNSQITDADKPLICQTIGAAEALQSNVILDITTEENVPSLIGTFANPLKWARVIMLCPKSTDGTVNALAYLCCNPDRPTYTDNNQAIYGYLTPVTSENRIAVMQAKREFGDWVAQIGHMSGTTTNNNSVYCGMNHVLCSGILTNKISNLTPTSQYNTIVGYNITAYTGVKYFPVGTRLIVIGEEA